MKLLLQQLADICRRKSWPLAVAESCTGGMLGDMITSFPGSSGFFLGGVIAYSDQVKLNLLKIPEGLLKKNGAVSSEVALSMSRGIKELLGASIGVSITGIAGPGGGSQEKPVGLVFISVITPESEIVERFNFSGNRREIKTSATKAAIELLFNIV